MSLKDKVVLVIGGFIGIGKVIVIKLVFMGVNIVINYFVGFEEVK